MCGCQSANKAESKTKQKTETSAHVNHLFLAVHYFAIIDPQYNDDDIAKSTSLKPPTYTEAVHRSQAVLLAEGAHAGEVRRIRTPRLLVLRPGAPALRRQDGVRRGHPQGHQQSRARRLNVFAKGFAMEEFAVGKTSLCNVEREAVVIRTLRCAEC